MICPYCKSRRTRKATVSSTSGQIHYIQCKNCEHVVYEAPDYVPKEQKERFINRIQKGKNDSTQ